MRRIAFLAVLAALPAFAARPKIAGATGVRATGPDVPAAAEVRASAVAVPEAPRSARASAPAAETQPVPVTEAVGGVGREVLPVPSEAHGKWDLVSWYPGSFMTAAWCVRKRMEAARKAGDEAELARLRPMLEWAVDVMIREELEDGE